MGRKSRPFADRFWEKVEKSTAGCWAWIGALDSNGYGVLERVKDGPQVRAHRASWEINVGPIPDGMNVLHHCDNPPCVRPDHLFLGTKADNTADMMTKGRHRTAPIVGVEHYRAKLTEADVRAIRLRLAEGHSQASVARTFRVSSSTISKIHCGLNWKHLAKPREG